MLSRTRIFLMRLAAVAVLLSVIFVLSIAATSPRPSPPTHICEPPRADGSSHTAAGGTDIQGLTLAALTQRSQAVLFGVVSELQSCLDEGFTFTMVSVVPEETIKDTTVNVSASASIKLRIAGGTYGGYTLGVSTSPEFTVGERVALFLRRDERQHLYPAGGSFSKLTIRPGDVVDLLGLSAQQLKEKILTAELGLLPPSEDPFAGENVEASFTTYGVNWPSFRLPVSLLMNAETNRPAQITAQQARLAAVTAFHAWQNLPDSYIAFGSYSNTDQPSRLATCSNVNPSDGTVRTTWGLVDPPGQPHPSGVLGVTYLCGDGSGIGHAEVQIDNDANHFGPRWRVDGDSGTCDGYIDLLTVLLHEYGHALGLGHPPSSNSGCNTSCPAMDASYGGVSRTPCADDQAGAAYLYPLSGTSPGAPSGLGAIRGGSVQLSWSDVSAELGYEIWRTAQPCSSALPSDFSLLDSVKAGVAAHTDNDYGGGLSPSLTYCYKVRSFNQAGVSAFSSAVQADGAPTPTPTPSPTPAPTASPGPTPTPTSTIPAVLKGDVDCSEQVNPVDALFVLRFVAELAPFASCIVIVVADVDCDGAIGPVDALHILRFVARLPASIPVWCAPIGQ